MLERANRQGRVIHPEFLRFPDFLAHVGPKPTRKATLDRINNADPEYAPGKVRWADKRTQNSNKGDTLLFHYSRTGDTYTVSRLAKLRKVTPSAIRKCRERGWTDDEIIEGKRDRAPLAISPGYHASPRQHPSARRDLPVPPSRPKTAKQIEFEEDRRDFDWMRQQAGGKEPCWDDYETARADCAAAGFVLTQEMWEKRWAYLWKRFGAHLRLERMPQWAQDLIAKIDPPAAEAARKRVEAKAQAQELL
jgi:hypothetical protein